ncbi:MAG: hypothetical protein V3U68_02625 [Bacteroidota bacterium]
MRGQGCGVFGLILTIFFVPLTLSQEKVIVSMWDFSERELEAQGLTLARETRLHITATGGGEHEAMFAWEEDEPMYAFAWIIDSETREPVWEMTMHNTSQKSGDRRFDGFVTLAKGSYEIYYAAYAYYYHGTFTHIHINVDHKTGEFETLRHGRKKSFWSFLSDWFDEDVEKEFFNQAPRWGIEVAAASSDVSGIERFMAPKNHNGILIQLTGLGENEVRRQSFTLSRSIPIHLTALGEAYGRDKFFDYGWIIDAETRNRVWEMAWHKARHAGGHSKNIKVDETIMLPGGKYELHYVTDDSHSLEDWNEKPPYDPLNWGIVLRATRESDIQAFTLTGPTAMKNVIVQLTKVGDDETRSAGFTLKSDATVRVYALGERYGSRRKLADYGLILNAKTREKVWQMRAENTLHAGGAPKNRYTDEIISLPKGSYLVYYNTDDSHSYEGWNASRPFDPEHWGITVTGWGKDFELKQITTFEEGAEEGVLAQVMRVGDSQHVMRRFVLDKPMHVRVYGLGEGQPREMVDYGWIENAKNGEIVWEMMYSKTSHAGGARKNRSVNSVIMLDRGEYILHYETDNSHSYEEWNDYPPEDVAHWGITVYREE